MTPVLLLLSKDANGESVEELETPPGGTKQNASTPAIDCRKEAQKEEELDDLSRKTSKKGYLVNIANTGTFSKATL